MKYFFLAVLVIIVIACTNSNAEYRFTPDKTSLKPVLTTANKYCWAKGYNIKNALINRIQTPEGFTRVEVEQGSFADWLRYLPLKEGKPDVHLYNKNLKGNQNVHHVVVDIDVGESDLQQCADAVMRMRAEYLYSKSDYENLHFYFTSGDNIGFKKWSVGNKVVINNNKVSWAKNSKNDTSYKSFRSYMNTIFMYAGTASLSKELKKVTDKKQMQIGDIFIVGGFPGHAVLIVDMCENKKTGEKLFLIQQSYMPAQEIHVLKNFNNDNLSPWYSINYGDELKTPEWTFSEASLMRF